MSVVPSPRSVEHEGVAVPPHDGWFFAKSAEAPENKRVEFFASGRSAQGCEKKGDRLWGIGDREWKIGGVPLPLCFCKRLIQQELEGGVGKNYEGEGLRRIVSQGNSGQVRERKDLSRIPFG